jgi:hypothetical protein
LIAVVAAVVPRLEMRLPTKRRPSRLLAVALPVTIATKLSDELPSRNSQRSTAKSVGVFVLVAVNTETMAAKFALNRKFWMLMSAAVIGMFAESRW